MRGRGAESVLSTLFLYQGKRFCPCEGGNWSHFSSSQAVRCAGPQAGRNFIDGFAFSWKDVEKEKGKSYNGL